MRLQLDEVLMLSSGGQVIGGSMSNVFLADDKGLFTPDLDRLRRRRRDAPPGAGGGARRSASR